MKPYIVVAGPTAAGKTDTAVRLAHLIGGEIISADSMQVYKYMDIGTAKPSIEERMEIPHYLVDELFPDEDYSAYEFRRRALDYSEDIRSRDLYPIICGGTGFYINALIKETRFDDHPSDDAYREELYKIAAEKGADRLHNMLKEKDPVSAGLIHPNNIKRVVRAMEFYRLTGSPISEHNAEMKASEWQNAKVAVLSMDRQILYDRINRRVDQMISRGLKGEVESILEKGYNRNLVSMQGLGYKEMAEHLLDGISLDDAITAIKTGTRHFAKRQLTWFSHQVQGNWYDTEKYKDPKELAEAIARDIL